MALFNTTFVFGVIVLLYLSSFVLFAILRILTGISIQRLGYLSLRRLAYTPRDGVKIEIRGLGLNLHRPTFAQPTWLSIVLTELAITVDLRATEKGKTGESDDDGVVEEEAIAKADLGSRPRPRSRRASQGPYRSKSWEKLTSVKEKIKRLHRKINWIRMVDVVASNTSVTIVDVGQIQVGSFTMAVDTRRKMVDRGRMFYHLKTPKKEQRPAEWMMTVRSVLFTPEGKESLEVLDHATLNVHGLLYKELDGLRDAAISLKLGRVHIPHDDINLCMNRFKQCQAKHVKMDPDVVEVSVTDLIQEIDRPGSRDMDLVQTVSDSKEFVSSILRGIKEVQFAVSYVAFTKKIDSVQPRGSPIYLNASMKEVGIDLHRLDQKSPAHRMYFASKDVAHQALVAALSIAIGVDDGTGKSDRLIYIPMATTTVRTTLPSKTVEVAHDNSADERNANILYANVVITSPSVDLDPKHLPLVLAILQPKSKHKKGSAPQRHVLISRLLPKANIKFSMHEPVIRVALPPVEKTAEEDDFDLIISSISSISLDIESSHSSAGELHYGLGSILRLQSHDLYYQTSSGAHYQLLETESLELKASLTANPEVYVIATGKLQTFSIRMIRPEISDGVRQIVRQLRTTVEPEKKVHPKTPRDPNFVRALPPWLLQFSLEGSEFSAEVAGIDEDISDETRGVALQLQSWTMDYRAIKADALERKSSRRRTGSRSLTPDPEIFMKMPQSPRKKQHQHPTDGRRLAVHIRGLEAFIVESAEKWETQPFVAMPRFEIALSTSSDGQGPIFHINSAVKTLLIQYSLYRHYAVGVATTVLRKAFVKTKADNLEAEQARATARKFSTPDLLSPISPEDAFPEDDASFPFPVKELITIDFRSTLLQVKAQMPSDPMVMLQIYGLEAGRHRWSPPFLHAKLARLYAEAPKMRQVWARIVSIKALQVDLRENRRKRSTGEMVNEKLIDVNTEAIRLAVPHQLVLHKIVDNFINTLKSVQQLHHRFVTGTNEYILEKQPEGPKLIPKISLRSRALLFELEDGAFEWKLGTIYRTGLIEQAQRSAREAAFRVKVKKIEEEEMRKDNSRFRNRSAHPRGRSRPQDKDQRRSQSEDEHSSGHHSHSHRGRRMRYDPEGTSGMTGSARVSIEEAREQLNIYNSQSWIKHIDSVFGRAKDDMKELRGVFWGPDELPDDMEETENILQVPQRPGLMATLISDLRISIDKPSFPIGQLPEFMHRVGKGMPYDMEYGLLVPMHVQIDMGEARITLRDYPLPLLHVPAIKPGQSARLPAWSMKTDFVIAEEFRGSESTRHVKVDIVPRKNLAPGTRNEGGFAIDVHRTVSPVKTYSDINIDINTGFPTRITWGASYQPAIQDMMMVVETFTKPQVDPSDRTGFWDKIRLSFHSRVTVAWKGDGDVHLLLKGTRDPYMITGNGAGFLMCWRSDVRWNLCRQEDPRKFMTVDSGEYILAIPDYSQQARSSNRHERESDSLSSSDSFRHGASFKKVVMKLSGNVQWLAGLMFERSIGGGKRSFDFEPHYKVIMKEPSFAKAPPGLPYDAFRGFRSHHIHLSIAVKAPVDREWSVSNNQPSKSYNTVHLTPRFFSHFFAWWSMFGGAMSLPIRQGGLWPGMEKSSKKFGRHLATIKYNLLLAPLFLSHMYKHKDAEDYAEDVVSATGLKMRLDSFMLDVHQRREEFSTHDKGRKTSGKTTGMKMHQAQLDLLSADIRAVTASIAGTTSEDLKKASLPTIVSQQDTGTTDLSHFEIPDNDFSWIDMDDFVELDWILPSQANPETKIMPLAYAPRFTYFRQTDHGGNIAGDSDRTSSFGNEPTHFCIMSKDDDPRRVQCQLIQSRLTQLEHQAESHHKSVGEAELELIKEDNSSTAQQNLEQLKRHGDVIEDKKLFLESMMRRMAMRIHTDNLRAVPDGDADVDSDGETPSPKDYDSTTEGMDTNPAADFVSDFNNRFVIHNVQLKWNNLLRNIILRYIHQVSQRRGFVYYLSRRAVKFILDIVEEQNKAKDPKPTARPSPKDARKPSFPASTKDDEPGQQDVQDRINEILADGKKFVDAVDKDAKGHNITGTTTEQLDSNIGRDFMPQNSYHLRLIAPQIQLQSDRNPKAVVLVTAKGMELKVVEVMDKDRLFDDVSGLVQRRFSVEMDSTQFFVTQQKWFSAQLLSMYSGNHYGVPSGSAWPPWVPLEVMFDFEVDPFGFKRVVQKTSASLRLDKYNTLRLKYNDEINGEGDHTTASDNGESRMDHLWVEFPQIRAICNSAQYYSMFVIVQDLLMYSEPLEKTRTERLEKIMLASDFSDLRGAPEMVTRLQERIRQMDEIKTQFQIHSKYLDKRGWEDRLALDKELTSCEDELFFMMKAITSSQRKYDATQTTGLLRWNISSKQIVWHLIRDNNEPLMEFQLKGAEYDRTDNADGSHINLMQIGKIVGLNLLPDAIYPEMFAPYTDVERGSFNDGGDQKMLRVYWNMLEAIAGIPVMSHFEVNLFPMKIQLEREVGKRLFDYIFPNSGDVKNKLPFGGGSGSKHMQPVQDEDEDEEEDNQVTTAGNSMLTSSGEKQDSASSTRAGSLELRLRPTMNSEARPSTAIPRTKPASLYASNEGSHSHFRLFNSSNKSSVNSRSSRTLNKKASAESMHSIGSRPTIGRTSTISSTVDKESVNGDARSKRFALHRKGKKEKPSDDLTEMMSRASNYKTLAYVKIPSVVLCLSYKGKGERNIEDVHDFVFRLPEIEYRNKTWSNMDLALQIKKDVIRALISHTGAIIGNKFSKHRPNTAQQSRLRELVTSSVLIAPSSQDNFHASDTTSTFNGSPTSGTRSERSTSPRRSFASSRNGLEHTPSESSSILELPPSSRGSNLHSGLMMTPSNKHGEGSITSSEHTLSKSMKSGHDAGFMSGALSRLIKKDKEGSSSQAVSNGHAAADDNDAESAKKKSKMLTKILGH